MNGMKKGGGGGSDMVLESRHLIGLFLGVVVLCGVFFTLGYVMGRTQFDTTVSAATVPSKGAAPSRSSATDPVSSPSATKTPMPAAGDWTFPAASETKKPADRLEPAPVESRKVAAAPDVATPATIAKSSAPESKPASKPVETSKPAPARLHAPNIPRGAVVLQVAALSRQSDALALADALQRKKFPAFVLDSAGSLYRVQVGPYADAASADIAKAALQREGFKAIVKK